MAYAHQYVNLKPGQLYVPPPISILADMVEQSQKKLSHEEQPKQAEVTQKVPDLTEEYDEATSQEFEEALEAQVPEKAKVEIPKPDPNSQAGILEQQKIDQEDCIHIQGTFKAKSKLVEKMQKELFTEAIAEGRIRDVFITPDMIKLCEDYNAFVARKDAKSQAAAEEKWKGRQWILCTINPPDTVDPLYNDINPFVHMIAKLASKKWMTQYAYVFEQRESIIPGKGFTQHYHGMHCHILFNRGEKTKHAVETEIYNTLKKLWPEKPNFHQLNYRAIKPGTEPNVYKYLRGIKLEREDGYSKFKKHNVDLLFRQRFKLEQIYEKNIPENFGAIVKAHAQLL